MKDEIIKQVVENEMSRILWDMAIPDLSETERQFIKERLVETASECIEKCAEAQLKAWEAKPLTVFGTPPDSDEFDEVCNTCGGTGEVSQMEAVYAGEPHMADVGTAPCPDCNNQED